MDSCLCADPAVNVRSTRSAACFRVRIVSSARVHETGAMIVRTIVTFRGSVNACGCPDLLSPMLRFAVPPSLDPLAPCVKGLSEDELVPYSALNEEAKAVPIGCEGLVRTRCQTLKTVHKHMFGRGKQIHTTALFRSCRPCRQLPTAV